MAALRLFYGFFPRNVIILIHYWKMDLFVSSSSIKQWNNGDIKSCIPPSERCVPNT